MLPKLTPVQSAADAPEFNLAGCRILILSSELTNTGHGRMALDMAIKIKAHGGEPFIAAPGGVLKLELQRRKIPFQTLPDMQGSAIGHMMAVFQLVNWLKFHRVHFIHTLDFSLARFAYEVMLKSGKHTIITLNQPVITALAARGSDMLRHFTRIIVPSTYAREQLLAQLSLPESVVRTILPGINLSIVHCDRIAPQKIAGLEKNWQLPDDRPVVVVPDCPLDMVIFDSLAPAFKDLKEKNIYTVLFAPEDERAYVLQRVAALGLSSHVIVTSDGQDRIAALWLAHAVLVTGFQGQDSLAALMEAQAMGRPVVAFDRNGLAEILLRDPATILLPGDQVSRLPAALAHILKLSTEQRHAFAFRSRAFVEDNFDRSLMINDVLALYQDMRDIQG